MIYLKLKIPNQIVFHYHDDYECMNIVVINGENDIIKAFPGPHLFALTEQDYDVFKKMYPDTHDVITEKEFNQLIGDNPHLTGMLH